MGILRLIRTVLCWGTLLVITGAAVRGIVVYAQINHEIQKYVLAELKKQYPDLHIRIGSAQIIEHRGLTVKDIEFFVPHHSGKKLPLLRVGELFIECSVTLRSLYQKNPKISRIIVKNPILRASRSASGTFDELHLLAGNEKDLFFPDGSKPVALEIENGTLFYDDARHTAPPLRLSRINLAAAPEIQDQTQRILLKGTADGDFFRRLDIEALVLPETEQWQCTANCRQFDWSDDLWEYLPPNPYFKERPHFQGRFDFKVSAISDAAADWGCRFTIGGELAYGRLDFPPLNRTLTELSTRFEITDERIVIDKLTGSGNSARFAASFVQEGLPFFGNQRQQAELSLDVHDLRFDEDLTKALSPFLSDEAERILAQYDYEGTTDLYAQFSCQNGRWHTKNLSMKVAELGFTYRSFPYRVDRLAGNLYVDETAALHFHFKSKQDNPLNVIIDGHYTNIFVDAAGKVEIVGEHVPIDPKLVHVLPPSVQQIAHSLHPSGKLHARLIFELPPGNVSLQRHFDIALDHVSLQYDHFPYPLRDVTGILNYDGSEWRFRDVSGTNGTAVIKGSGYLRPIGGGSNDAQEFVLHVLAEELPIDDQMTQALTNPKQRQLLQSLNVNGKVNLAAQIQYRTDDRRVNLHFQAVPRAGLSICSDRFPYKIEDVAGEIRYENGHIFAQTPLTGTHRSTKLRSGLDCQFTADGQSVLRFGSLAIDQLQADRELLDALPKHLQDFLESMQITKPFNLSGGIEYRQTAQGEQTVSWGLNWILHQNGAQLGIPVENIFGIVQLTGRATADRIWLNGELYLDSLTAYGFQTTSVRGPFFFDGARLQLGIPENRLNPETVSRPLTGKLCDGTIRADGLVVLGNGVTYDINADLTGADLAKIVREIEPAAQRTTGTLNCSNIQLRGIGTSWETVGGTGTIQIREANLYGAPVMVQLLRELRIRETDPNAGMFSSMDVNFSLSGRKMFFDSVVFEGGLIFMQGSGMMLLDTRYVDLAMRTRLGSRRMQIPVVSDFFGAAGDQLVQLKITGPLSDPSVNRVVVPEIQRALQQIQPEESRPQVPVVRERSTPSRLFPWNPL